MLSIGRARHPGPGTSSYPPGFSIEFLNVGGWLSRGDLALESSAHFLAVAEHRLVPARARTVTYQLRQARRSSVWAPSCQDVTPGGHAGVGVIRLHGATLSLPTLLDFFRIGRDMRVILPLGNGGGGSSFLSFMAAKALRMIQRSFSSLNISLLPFWLKLGCAVLVNRLFLLVILTLILLSSPLWPRVFLMANGSI